MWDVKPGDLVVCVNAAQKPNQPVSVICHELQINQIYTVREVVSWPGQEMLALRLEEIVAPVIKDGRELSFHIDRFRPVSKTRTEEFRKLVAPAPRALVEA